MLTLAARVLTGVPRGCPLTGPVGAAARRAAAQRYQPLNGSHFLLKYHVGCEIPEQLSAPAVPGQPPLSRCEAHIEISLMPLLRAQFSTVVASASVQVS